MSSQGPSHASPQQTRHLGMCPMGPIRYWRIIQFSPSKQCSTVEPSTLSGVMITHGHQAEPTQQTPPRSSEQQRASLWDLNLSGFRSLGLCFLSSENLHVVCLSNCSASSSSSVLSARCCEHSEFAWSLLPTRVMLPSST